MLLMPSTDINFQSLADNITADFFVKGVSLEDGVVKVAKDQSLNPEEVTRLVEKTNTTASCYFLKTAGDKKASFSLAHIDLVLKRTHPTEDQVDEIELDKTASVYEGLPIKSKFTKVAKEKSKPVKQQKTASQQATNIFTLRAEIESKKLEKLALEKRVADRIDFLASEFYSNTAPDFRKFAADCRAVYGKICQPVLDGLGEYLRVSLKGLPKTASYINDTTENMSAMREICSGLRNIIKTGAEISEMQKALNWLWADAKGLQNDIARK